MGQHNKYHHRIQRIQAKQVLALKNNSAESGSAVLAIIAVVLAGSALLATMTSSWRGASGVARRDLANSAQDAAEAGLTMILENLNAQFPYYLASSSSKWSTLKSNSTICSTNSKDGPPTQSGDVGSLGSYELEEYVFNGNPIFGGTAYLRVKGTATNSSNTASSTATVEQKIQIIPKFCDEPFGSGGFPGLYSQTMDIGNNDVRGTDVVVLCTQCQDNIPNNCSVNENTALQNYTEADKKCVIGSNTGNTIIDGTINIGPQYIPPVAEAPEILTEAEPEITPAEIDSSLTIATISSSSDAGDLPDYCKAEMTDGIFTTHCLIDSISLNSDETLEIDTTNGPARLYLLGDITLNGNDSLISQTGTGTKATKLGIFGLPENSDNQTVTLNGQGRIDNAWLYFPDGTVTINGGANDPTCTDGDCSGGDIHGAVWAAEFNGSNGQKVEITVPLDLGEDVYYPDTKLGNQSFVGAGVLSFRTLRMDSD